PASEACRLAKSERSKVDFLNFRLHRLYLGGVWSGHGGAMSKGVRHHGGNLYQLANSHLITTCATLAALILFVMVGAKVVPSAIGLAKASQPALVAAFLLNIAIILFGWRRASDISLTLSALKVAEQEALDNAYTD